jgi:hypothetical protein
MMQTMKCSALQRPSLPMRRAATPIASSSFVGTPFVTKKAVSGVSRMEITITGPCNGLSPSGGADGLGAAAKMQVATRNAAKLAVRAQSSEIDVDAIVKDLAEKVGHRWLSGLNPFGWLHRPHHHAPGASSLPPYFIVRTHPVCNSGVAWPLQGPKPLFPSHRNAGNPPTLF